MPKRSAAITTEPVQAPLAVHELNIPDELLAWAQEPAQAVSWPRQYGQEAAQLISRGGERPLDPSGTERLLGCLDAICAQAIRAGRHDLLGGFDMLTAEWLNLSYTFEHNGVCVTLSRNGTWTYQEVRVLLSCDDPSLALERAERVKNLIGEVFPGARIGGMMAHDDTDGGEVACSTCGEVAQVTVTLDSGGRMCAGCYRTLCSPWPKVGRRAKKAKGKG